MIFKNHPKKLVRPAYFWKLSKQANYSHERIETVSTPTNAPQHILLVCVDAPVPLVPRISWIFAFRRYRSKLMDFSVSIKLPHWIIPHEHGAVAHTDPENDSFAMPAQT